MPSLSLSFYLALSHSPPTPPPPAPRRPRPLCISVAHAASAAQPGFTKSDRAQVVLMITMQEHAFVNQNFLKIFCKFVLLMYKVTLPSPFLSPPPPWHTLFKEPAFTNSCKTTGCLAVLMGRMWSVGRIVAMRLPFFHLRSAIFLLPADPTGPVNLEF